MAQAGKEQTKTVGGKKATREKQEIVSALKESHVQPQLFLLKMQLLIFSKNILDYLNNLQIEFIKI